MWQSKKNLILQQKKIRVPFNTYVFLVSEDLLILTGAPVLIYSGLSFLMTVILKSLLTGGKEFFLWLVCNDLEMVCEKAFPGFPLSQSPCTFTLLFVHATSFPGISLRRDR